MISPEEAARQREMVRKFHTHLRKQMQVIIEALDARGPSPGFGAYDEDEYRKAVSQHEQIVAQLCAQKNSLESFWSLVKEIFGKDTVDLAIEEGEQRIGSLPYVEG